MQPAPSSLDALVPESPAADEQRAHLSAWLRLNHEYGVGPVAMRHMLAAFGLPHQILQASHGQLAQVVGNELATVLKAPASPELQTLIERALTWVEQPQNHIITLADACYPAALLQVADPPPLLYVVGQLHALQQPMVAVVGARNATTAGIEHARAFSSAFASAGLGVVSGMALGVDGAAHEGALDAVMQPGSAGTVAVIGTGADVVYPSRHRELAHRIAQHPHSCIVSEFALGAKALNHHFPRRNRIISGLARGVLVVEAALQSGSLITARQAGEQGREVFAIPGSIHSPTARGCHALIKQGAKLVESAQDVLEELGMQSGVERLNQQSAEVPSRNARPARAYKGAASKAPSNKLPEAVPEPKPVIPVMQPTQAAGNLLVTLGFDPISVDLLTQRSGLDAAQVSTQLLELELNGQLQRLPGGLVQRLH